MSRPPPHPSPPSHTRSQSQSSNLDVSAASLERTLTALELQWNYEKPNNPFLIYTLTHIDGVQCKHAKYKLVIDLASDRPQCRVMDRETVSVVIELSQLIAVDRTSDEPHLTQLVYNAAVTNTHASSHGQTSSNKSKFKSQSPTNTVSRSTCQVVRLTFASLRDIDDVTVILRAMIALCNNPTAPLSSITGSVSGQLCLHKGAIDIDGKKWMKLFPNRLLVFKTGTSALPHYCIPLTLDSHSSHAIVTGKGRSISIANIPSIVALSSGLALLSFKCATVEEQQKWFSALQTEQQATFKTPVQSLITVDLRLRLRMKDDNDSEDSEAPVRSTVTTSQCAPATTRSSSDNGTNTSARHNADNQLSLNGTNISARLDADNQLSLLFARSVSAPSATSSLSQPKPSLSLGATNSNGLTVAAAPLRSSFSSAAFDSNPIHDSNDPSSSWSPTITSIGAALTTVIDYHASLSSLTLTPTPLSNHQHCDAPLSLSSLLSSPHSFFAYLQHLASLPILSQSSLPSLGQWQKRTPQQFLKKRGKSMLAIDSALTQYHRAVSAIDRLWSETRLYMLDSEDIASASQIQFSFLGFNSQRFDVGRLSVIACHQLFAAHVHSLTFTNKDFEAALASSSPAKEMMQSSPDVDELYSQGPRGMEEAKSLSFQAQRLVLHHCILATYLKSRIGSSVSESDSVNSSGPLKTNEILSWPSILHSLESLMSGNEDLLNTFRPIGYIVNPSLSQVQSLIQSLTLRDLAPTAAVYASFPSMSDWSPLSSTSSSPSASPLTSQPSSPKQRKLGSLFHTGKGNHRRRQSSVEPTKSLSVKDRRSSGHVHSNSITSITLGALISKPVTPLPPTRPQDNHGRQLSVNASPPQQLSPSLSTKKSRSSWSGAQSNIGEMFVSHASPAPSPVQSPPTRMSSQYHTSTGLPLFVPSTIADIRPLVNPLHLLLVLRALLVSRLQSLTELVTACNDWCKRHSNDSDKLTDRVDSVAHLLSTIEEERATIGTALRVLPDYDALDTQREQQEREEKNRLVRGEMLKRRHHTGPASHSCSGNSHSEKAEHSNSNTVPVHQPSKEVRVTQPVPPSSHGPRSLDSVDHGASR